jgi:membrane protein implicated in regulation of membrane protease activity
MNIDYFSQVLSNFDPWWMIAFAIVLVLIDWALIQTEAFMTVGIGIFFAALLNAVDAPPILQLWSLPILAFIAYLVQRPIYSKLASKQKSPYESLDNEVDSEGTLIVRYNSSVAAAHYFKYKENIDLEKAPEETVDYVCKVSLKDGRVFPALLQEGLEVQDGLNVRVTEVQNGALKVEPL